MEDENISTFASITGATADVARGFLNLANDDISRAVELFFENPDLASSVQQANNPPAAAASTQRQAPSRPRHGRQDSRGVIHLDSDDEMDVIQSDDDDDFERANAAQTAAAAQEEEDAAMAKRLQEELYGSGGPSGAGGADPDDVRAPIARTTETLVAPDPAWTGAASAYDSPFLVEQLRRQRQQNMPRTSGPFSQRIWNDDSDAGIAARVSNSDGIGGHAQRLADLFRPPFDLMSRGLEWDDARSLGKDEKKWIMVNLQDMSDFNCQALNRDIWKDQAVKSLISENFIFLQYDKDYPDAEAYMTFYFPNRGHENPENYPHVSIVDPRTGEQVKVWSGRPFPSASSFHAEVAEFLDRYSLERNSKNPVAQPTAKKPQTVDVDRMTEDEMLEMALKNSLANQEAGSSGGSSSTPNIHDPDALTKAGAPVAEEPAAPPPSKFAQISNTNPHVEPDNNPAMTTRIQFRHPTGRVIRRFNLQDQVERIFEWLKTEPLEGREGVEFELKKMPQGQDLIDSLDQTIEAAGLKQGTVMIEFIED